MTAFSRDLGAWFEDNASQVQQDLGRYFGGDRKDQFTGRWFEHFAAVGDPNRFEASDVLAADTLLVRHEVPPEATAKLLLTDGERFNSLLRELPWATDIWEVRRSELSDISTASDLHQLLRDELPGVDWVTAGKLLAAKRPRLIPVLDKEVREFLTPPQGQFWVTMYDVLSDESRRTAISEVCRAAAPPFVSLLRRMDVALWMAAKRENST
jgi:hypothetical protein